MSAPDFGPWQVTPASDAHAEWHHRPCLHVDAYHPSFYVLADRVSGGYEIKVEGPAPGAHGHVRHITKLSDALDVADAIGRGFGWELAKADPECTGLSATWCPVHGDCTCPYEHGREDNGRTLDGPTCPLHAPESTHGNEDETDAELTARLIREHAREPGPAKGAEDEPPSRRIVHCLVCHKTHAVKPDETPCAPGAWGTFTAD